MERTDLLAARAGVSLRSLAPMMGLSVASLFGYRKGSIPVSPKGWSKLEQLEASVRKPAARGQSVISATKLNESDSTAEENHSVLREDPTPYRAVVEEIAKQAGAGDQASLLERIAVALEKLVEIEERKNP